MPEMPGGFHTGFGTVFSADKFAGRAADAAVINRQRVRQICLERGAGLGGELVRGDDDAVTLHNEVRAYAQFTFHSVNNLAPFLSFNAMVEELQILLPSEAQLGPADFLGPHGNAQVSRAHILGRLGGLNLNDDRLASIHHQRGARSQFFPWVCNLIESAA